MKHISNKSFAWLSCFLLVACQPEEVTTAGSGNTLQVASVNLENEGNTRAAVTSIKEVMVYVTDNVNAAIAANSQSKFTFDGSSWSCLTPPELTDVTTFNIYAWYPSQKDASGKEIAVTNNADGNHYIPVQVESEDSFTDQKQKDYLYADQTSGQITASTTSKSVRFKMKHALSKVSFEITKDISAKEALTLTQVDIISGTNSLQTGTNGQMYLKNGTLNNLSAKGKISLTGSLTLNNTSLSAPNISVLVAPMMQPEKVLSFRLHVSVNGEQRIFETGTVSTVDGVLWKAGQHNVYQIKVSKIGSTIKGVAVYDWKKDSDQNTQVGI